MEGFLAGEMRYVVATDAIGMGLNLPIRRVIFMDTEKFDGVERRELRPEEIQQIAGPGGGMVCMTKGFVGATQNLGAIRAGLNTVVPPLQQAVAGFSDLVLQVEFDLLEVLTEWNRMPTVAPYVKLDITRYLTLISKIREQGFRLTRRRSSGRPTSPSMKRRSRCGTSFPVPPAPPPGGRHSPGRNCPKGHPDPAGAGTLLPKAGPLLLLCQGLRLPGGRGGPLRPPGREVAEEINEILLHRLKNNIRFCAVCGAALPLHHHGRLCEACYRKQRRR